MKPLKSYRVRRRENSNAFRTKPNIFADAEPPLTAHEDNQGVMDIEGNHDLKLSGGREEP